MPPKWEEESSELRRAHPELAFALDRAWLEHEISVSPFEARLQVISERSMQVNVDLNDGYRLVIRAASKSRTGDDIWANGSMTQPTRKPKWDEGPRVLKVFVATRTVVDLYGPVEGYGSDSDSAEPIASYVIRSISLVQNVQRAVVRIYRQFGLVLYPKEREVA